MLKREDWVNVKTQAERAITQAEISFIINIDILHKAETELKKYPKPKEPKKEEPTKGVE